MIVPTQPSLLGFTEGILCVPSTKAAISLYFSAVALSVTSSSFALFLSRLAVCCGLSKWYPLGFLMENQIAA